MKQAEDTKTVDMLGLPRRRGRPPGSTPARSSAERMADLRARRLAEGRGTITITLPLDVIAALDEFVRFKDTNKDAVIERAIRSAILRKR